MTFLSAASSLISYLRQVTGWKRFFAAFVFGSLVALAMPPFNFFPLLWVSLPALIFLLQGTKNDRQAFVTGWAFAFGFLVFGLYWIAASMFVDIAMFWWAVPLSVAGLPAFLSIYYGIAAVVACRLGLSGLRGAVLFGLLWFLADYARGHILTGFPWILLGYAWSGVLPVLQITSIVGIYGLTLFTAVAACLPAALEDKTKPGRTAFALSLVLFALIALWGEVRLQTTKIETVPGVRIRLVQPNVEQAKKWRMEGRERDFNELISLSARQGEKPVTHIIWPETASTYYLTEDALRRHEISANIAPDAEVLTGVIRREADDNRNVHFYNSLVVIQNGSIVAAYDKAHLVPFGEFMPLRKYIPIRTLAASGADFSRGPGPQTLRVDGLPTFSPLICYEAIFPGEVADPNDRPNFLVNVTNDGWYGRSTGPYQHFAIARIRAIEEGLPLMRVANTGISGFVDPLGRVGEKLDLGEQGTIDSDLAKPLPVTVFARQKEILVWSCFFIMLLGVAAFNAKKFRVMLSNLKSRVR